MANPQNNIGVDVTYVKAEATNIELQYDDKNAVILQYNRLTNPLLLNGAVINTQPLG